MSNQHLICLLGPAADRRSALTVVMDMIWKLEESPAFFQVGVFGDPDARFMRFQASIVCSVNITECIDSNLELLYLGAPPRSPRRQEGQLGNDLAHGRCRYPSMPRVQCR
jgi:hypothetical protein